MATRKIERYFTVSGRGTFPFDMLRYDGCDFATEADREKAGKPDSEWSETRERREIRLVARDINSYSGAPTVGRWNSFLWGVASDSVRDVKPGTPDPMAQPKPARSRIVHAWHSMSGANEISRHFRTEGKTDEEFLQMTADAIEEYGLVVRQLYEKLEKAEREAAQLRGQREAVRSFFGITALRGMAGLDVEG